jgi:hypothetical protein
VHVEMRRSGVSAVTAATYELAGLHPVANLNLH